MINKHHQYMETLVKELIPQHGEMAINLQLKDIVIDDKVLVFGEVGLSGEVRAVSMAEQRVQEAKKLGFTKVILPAACMKSVGQETEITLIPVDNIRDAVRFLEQKR